MIQTSKYTGILQNLQTYVVADVETTGLNAKTDEIVEIALLKVEGGKITGSYNTLINPLMHIPSDASAIHGIYDHDVANAPTKQEVAPAVAGFLLDRIVVAHNASFDARFLAIMLESCGISGSFRTVDTLFYARRLLPDLENHKQPTLARYFGIDEGQAHHADDDVRTCFQLFQALQQLPQDKLRQSAGQHDYEGVRAAPRTPPPVRTVERPQQRQTAKSRGLAFVLCLFFGALGAHRFYVGKYGTGLLYLFTAGCYLIGWFADLVSIIRGTFTDKSGYLLQ